MTRAKSMKATTVFEQPFKGVWLPHSVNAEAILTVASGPLEIHYSREFTGYKRAEVSTRIQPVPTEKQ
jgi:hypothetical protein